MSQPVPVSTMAVAGSPGLGVAIATVQGWGVQEWAAAATLIYMLLLIGFLIWDRGIKVWRHKRDLKRIADAARERGKSGRGPRG